MSDTKLLTAIREFKKRRQVAPASSSNDQCAMMARPLPDWVPKETPGKEETTGYVPVSSSWIGGLKYTPERGAEMTVKKGGKNYNYPGFNLAKFKAWVKAQSKGKWWWRNVGHVMLSRFTGEVHPLLTAAADTPVYVQPEIAESARQAMSQMLGKEVTHAHMAALGGYLPGTRFNVTHSVNWRGHPVINFNTHGRGYTAERSFTMQDGKPSIHNDIMRISKDYEDNPHRGVSGGVLLRQMRAAHEVGIPKIDWYAMGSPSEGDRWSGGLHWPLLGADGEVPDETVQKMPSEYINQLSHMNYELRDPSAIPRNREFTKSPTFKDFFSIPGARDWYADNNFDSHNAFVETHPGSYSRMNVEKHVAENAMYRKTAPPTPDAHHVSQQPAYKEPEPVELEPAYKPIPLEHVPTKREDLGALKTHPNDAAYGTFIPHKMSRLREFLSGRRGPAPRHPMTEHLLRTHSLHPDYYDDYFEI